MLNSWTAPQPTARAFTRCRFFRDRLVGVPLTRLSRTRLPGVLFVERHHVGVAHARAAKNIQRRTNRQVNPSLPQPCHVFQIAERVCPPAIRGRNPRPSPKVLPPFPSTP